MNVRQKTLAALLVLGIGMSGCNTTNTPSTIKVEKSKKEASQVIVAYAVDNTKPAPTVQDYTDAKITGVSADNLATINAKLGTLAASISVDNVVDLVQKMVNDVIKPVVGSSDDILEQIAKEHKDHYSIVTITQLQAILPALENINDDYENIYRTYIASADTNISSPATIEELQHMIDEVNALNLPDNAILDKNFYKKTHNKFEHRFVYLPVTNSKTGRTWLNNNLGAWYANVGRNIYNPSQQATNANDNYAKGSLFQWGRKADGHELVTRWWGNGTIDQLATTTTKSDNPTDGKFIAVNSDWRVHPNDDLWKGIDAPNNPCPAHYRVPTKKELDVEAQTWNALTADGSMSSLLKIPGPGWLNSNGYGMFYPGGAPRIWDTTPGVAWRPHETHSLQRTNGLPLRCIKEQTPAERSVSILKEIGNEHRNHKSIITIEDLKAITPALNHINDNHENIYRTYIASADKSFSSPATRDEVQSMITEVNRLGSASEATRTLIATQHSSHKSTLTVAQLKAINLLKNIQDNNEKWYQSYIEGSDTHFSSPATIEELQHMIDEVNSLNLPDNAILDKNFYKKTHNKFEHRFVYLPVTNSNTGRTWLNNNLGAWYANVGRNIYNPSQQATNANDNYAKGSLFQWGRKADGHELVTRWWGNGTIDQLATTTTKSDNPTDGKFIAVNSDWRVHPNDDLWKGINAPNNPCPAHYRVPTKKELDVEAQTWNALTADGSMSSRLKIPGPGWLNSNGYGMFYPGGAPRIWDTTAGVAWRPHETHSLQRTNGLPLRCIKEQTPAERSRSVLLEIGNEHNSNKSIITIEDLKAITPALENINDNYESNYRTYIASADSNFFSSPATRDEVQQMITEVNRLGSASEATRTLIATQHSSHKSTLTVAQLKAIDLLKNIQDNNEKFYQNYIEGADTHFSSPATIEELQRMIDEVNSLNLPDNAILDKNFFKKTHNKFEHRFVYLPVTNSETGRTWLNNNLGAWYANVGRNIYNPSQQATNANDNYAKGSLFQWGRKADGHELVTRWWSNGTIDQLATTTTKSDNPTDGKFIAVNSDWRVHPNDDLWKGINAPNNPCPAHYRVPTKKELDVEAQTWNSLTADGSMSSLLKIPGPGWLNSNGYGMFYPGGAPRIWDTTPGVAWRPHETHSLQRTNGLPLRCIKEQTPAERSRSVLLEIRHEHRSNKSIITIEDLKAITPGVRGINDDYENIYRTYIVSVDKSFSSPATRDEVQQMITEIQNLNLPAHAIVDRSFFKKTNNKFEHRFVYLPVTNSTTGRTWLNNNLGAEYANMDSSKYNPAQQAKSKIDLYAYGSEFQWGREADGHELMTWTDATHGTGKYGITKTQNDNPTDSLFIAPDFSRFNAKYTWRVSPDNNLWRGVDAPNNPCPIGYRLATNDQTQPAGANNEWLEEGLTWRSEDFEGAYDSKLKLTIAGWRDSNNNIEYAGTLFGNYWSASVTSDGKVYRFISLPSSYHGAYWNNNYISIAIGSSVRCIKN